VLSVAVLLLARGTTAQNSQPAAPPNSPTETALPVGSTIYAALDKTIDAKKAKPGDSIVARVTFPVLAHGKILIENGAKILGHVTIANSRSKDSAKSQLGIVFDHATLKGGEQMPLNLTVQAIGFEGLLPAERAQAEPSPFPTSSASAQPVTKHTPSGLPSPPQPGDTQQGPEPEMEAPAALDAGSKGAVNLPGLTLTEGTDAKQGSLVRSDSRNVKLERGYAVVLRVIASELAPTWRQKH
jgi:hypothetical protein